ncbi:hypothetical protein [Hymenobacter daeguensis]
MSTTLSTSTLGLTLMDEVASDHITDLTADAAEALLDSMTDAAEVLEAFPVFGSAVKLIRAGFSIHDRLFLRKLSKFLLELHSVSVDERYEFVREFDRDPSFKKRVGEKLILLLDRFDDLEKAAVLGKLFRAFMVGRADYHLFGRLSGIVDRAYLPDLSLLKRFEQDTPGSDAILALEALGLVYQSVLDGGNAAGVSVHRYSISSLGQKLARLLF